MANLFEKIKKYLLFNEPVKNKPFILEEHTYNSMSVPTNQSQDKPTQKKSRRGVVHKLLGGSPTTKIHTEYRQNRQEKIHSKSQINLDLTENLKYIKKRYSYPSNSDVIIREFDIQLKDKTVKAFIVYIDGMVDSKLLNESILQPLMILSNINTQNTEEKISSYIVKKLLPHKQVSLVKEYDKVVEEVNFGGCGIFIDGEDIALVADIKGWEHRNVDRPNTELLIRGPQEGFNEIIRVNTALIRKILKDENLVVENMQIGKRSKTPCAVLYIRNIANNSLVKEVKNRIANIQVDYIFDAGELEQLLEDFNLIPSPQIAATERPDRTAAYLTEGKVAVLLHGSPFALILPTTFHELTHSAEDAYVRFPYGNLLRMIRVLGLIFSLLLPAFYVAITNFHHEVIPTDLLLAITAARERVPFPSVVEILIMEVSFELIREAGMRIPGPIGPTLGIIGALILGQAAVAANIVSPILIVIVAVTGIGSFSVPDFSLALSFRILRFFYIVLAATAGFLGISFGLFLHGLNLVNAKSFGVPYMTPFGPKTFGGISDTLFREPIWTQETRTDFLNPKDTKKQPPIVRNWANPQQKEDQDE